MVVAITCRNDFKNKLVLNIISKNLKKLVDKDLRIDLILIGKKKSHFDEIIFEKKEWTNLIEFEFSKKSLQRIRKTDYDHLIEIGVSFKSLFISGLIKTKNKVSRILSLKKLSLEVFKKRSVSNYKKNASQILREIFETKFEYDLNLDFKVENQKTNELISWIFQTSYQQKFSETKFILFYYDIKNSSIEIISEIIKIVYDTFKMKIILIITSKSRKIGYQIYDKLENKYKMMVVKNFIDCKESDQIYLFIKNCSYFITNNQDLTKIFKVASNKDIYEIKSVPKKSFLNFFNRYNTKNSEKSFENLIYDLRKINS